MGRASLCFLDMDLKRFFCDEKINGDIVKLSGDEFYHAVKVTRHKVGYKLILCDNGNYDYYATIKEINRDFLIAKIDKRVFNPVESDFKLNLYIGNNKDIDSVVQKAVEMGVNSITPFVSERCNVKEINYERLNKIVLESSKQCGRARLATINEQITFEEAVTQAKTGEVFLFYEFEDKNFVRDTLIKSKEISIFIGTEGGFSEEEIAFAHKEGIKTYSLGKRIMRVATAVVSACALVNDKAEGSFN